MIKKTQIGTIAYKKCDRYFKSFPLLENSTKELTQAQIKLFNTACQMFIQDLVKQGFKKTNGNKGDKYGKQTHTKRF